MSELIGYIKSYFEAGENELQTIANHFTPRVFRKGEYFLKTGRVCSQLSFIGSGLVRIFATAGDKEITQWITTPGYFITDLSSFVFERPARWHMQALTDGECYTIDKAAYDSLDKKIASWQKLEKLFIAKCFIMLEDRVFTHLSMTAKERYDLLLAQQPELFNLVPLQYLASMIGMAPETLSRLRR